MVTILVATALSKVKQINTALWMPEMDENENIQARALRLLEAIYEKTVNTGNSVHATKLAVTIGSTEQEALAAWQYLKEKNLIKTYNIAGEASVNASGIDIYENARSHPDNPPPGFGSITYNNVTIHHVEGGGIQVAGSHSTQHQSITYNSKDYDDLRHIVEIFTQRIDELNLDDAAKRDALAQVETIKAQLSVKPNPTIIKEAGRSLRSITEGVVGGLVASRIEHWQLVYDVLSRMFPFS
jgi:hypothetical protein